MPRSAPLQLTLTAAIQFYPQPRLVILADDSPNAPRLSCVETETPVMLCTSHHS